MKFLALMKKEMREILPWILLAAIVFASVGALITKMEMTHPRYNWNHGQIKAGQMLYSHYLFSYSQLSNNGAWLFAISLAMGIILAVRQFWIPFITKTWQFELHRSVSRSTILLAKMITAVIGFCISIGAIWIGLYLYASRPGVFMIQPAIRSFVEGWIFIGMGLTVYLAIALAALTRARWYTTKIFGPLFAAFIIALIISQTSLYWAFGFLAVGLALLLSQVTHTFLNREF